jgi:hypothetical protein
MADGAEKDRVRVRYRVARGGWQRGTCPLDTGGSDGVLRDIDPVAEEIPDGLQHAERLRRHLGTDPVSRQHRQGELPHATSAGRGRRRPSYWAIRASCSSVRPISSRPRNSITRR